MESKTLEELQSERESAVAEMSRTRKVLRGLSPVGKIAHNLRIQRLDERIAAMQSPLPDPPAPVLGRRPKAAASAVESTTENIMSEHDRREKNATEIIRKTNANLPVN
jgi:hypothetical protein